MWEGPRQGKVPTGLEIRTTGEMLVWRRSASCGPESIYLFLCFAMEYLTQGVEWTSMPLVLMQLLDVGRLACYCGHDSICLPANQCRGTMHVKGSLQVSFSCGCVAEVSNESCFLYAFCVLLSMTREATIQAFVAFGRF